jgi:cell shape-determining protein MreC
MPKFAVGLVSAAFALVIGFTCGALLTVPKNSRMEILVNENRALKENVTDLKNKVLSLQIDVNSLKENNQQLKDRLLQAYKEKEDSHSTTGTPAYP